MHFHCEIWMPEKSDWQGIVDYVAREMAPYQEHWECACASDIDCVCEPVGWWDWYQIGGRWKGVHVPGYDAHDDPENIGVGRFARPGELSWPTEWPVHPIDVIAIGDLPKDFRCYRLILGERVFVRKELNPDWDREKHGFDDPDVPFYIEIWDGNVTRTLADNGLDWGYLVTVDYHN